MHDRNRTSAEFLASQGLSPTKDIPIHPIPIDHSTDNTGEGDNKSINKSDNVSTDGSVSTHFTSNSTNSPVRRRGEWGSSIALAEELALKGKIKAKDLKAPPNDKLVLITFNSNKVPKYHFKVCTYITFRLLPMRPFLT